MSNPPMFWRKGCQVYYNNTSGPLSTYYYVLVLWERHFTCKDGSRSWTSRSCTPLRGQETSSFIRLWGTLKRLRLLLSPLTASGLSLLILERKCLEKTSFVHFVQKAFARWGTALTGLQYMYFSFRAHLPVKIKNYHIYWSEQDSQKIKNCEREIFEGK